MADRKISELTNITGANVDDANDEIAIVDASASQTKAITRAELFSSVSALSVDGNITVGGTVDGRDVAADGTKLDGIEAGADVTDTANVTAAGALMDSELTNITAVKALNQGVATTDSPTFAGLTTTADVSFGDNDKAIFGAGSDLQIYHDGTHSYVSDEGTGSLRLRGVDIQMQNTSGINFAKFVSGADVQLFYAGSQKLATTSTGVDVTGTVTADGLTVESTSPTILNTTGTDGSTIGTLYFSNTQGGSSGIHAGIRGIRTTAAAGAMEFYTKNAGGQYKRMTIDNLGDIHFYEDTGTTPKFFWDASAERLGIGTSSPSERLDVSGNVTISGSLSKGSGSFKIDHPIKPDTHHLVHSFLEGPQADNLYRGKVALVDGEATVNLDDASRMTEGTFVALNGNVQCFTTNEDGWTQVRGRVEGNILTIEAQDVSCNDTVSWFVIGERHDQHMIGANWTDEQGRVITEPAKKTN